LTATQGGLLSVAAWYDNEMGYSARLAETAALIAREAAVTTVGRPV
jgi:glyceraldehyde 3-phosphate dehydrogenase